MARVIGGIACLVALGSLGSGRGEEGAPEPRVAAPEELALSWDEGGGLEIRGTAVGRAEDVSVYPLDADWSDPTYPSVAGSLERRSDGRRLFVPRYPPPAGDGFVVVARGTPLGTVRSLPVTVRARDDRDGPHVVAVFPTAERVPENQLKLYAEFSRPMRPWDPYDHVTLVDETTGATVRDAFQALRDGLWDPAGTRLTMVFDPGRVKRGLSTNEALGPPLVRGHTYRLEIGATWLDASGRPLREPFAVRFSVGEPDRTRPDPERWTVTAPGQGSRDPVVVDFGESMDRALLGSMVDVQDESGASVLRGVYVGPGERTWSAVPRRPWGEGEYTVVVDCRIEDLAGNNVERLFDVDLASDGEMPESADGDCAVELPFSVGGLP